MRYTPVTCEQREAMLRAVGVSSVDELFEVVPAEVRLTAPLDLPDGIGVIELASHLSALASANTPAQGLVSFLGAGCYDHYVPSVVDHSERRVRMASGSYGLSPPVRTSR